MDDREKLYPTCGKLYPKGLGRLAKCEDYDQVKGVADCYPAVFAGAGTNPGEKTLEDKFFMKEVEIIPSCSSSISVCSTHTRVSRNKKAAILC